MKILRNLSLALLLTSNVVNAEETLAMKVANLVKQNSSEIYRGHKKDIYYSKKLMFSGTSFYIVYYDNNKNNKADKKDKLIIKNIYLGDEPNIVIDEGLKDDISRYGGPPTDIDTNEEGKNIYILYLKSVIKQLKNE